mgnify:CR=1 FL=1
MGLQYNETVMVWDGIDKTLSLDGGEYEGIPSPIPSPTRAWIETQPA